MKLWLHLILVMCLLVSLMGCATINTYPPGYEKSDFEKSIGPPMWLLNESNSG
jgi:hypothetical protein